MYVHHEQQKFVIVVLRDDPGGPVDAPLGLGKAISQVNQLLDKRNPFGWCSDEPVSHKVVAIEVPWSSIVGIDYRCPLHGEDTSSKDSRTGARQTAGRHAKACDHSSTDCGAECMRACASVAPTQKRFWGAHQMHTHMRSSAWGMMPLQMMAQLC